MKTFNLPDSLEIQKNRKNSKEEVGNLSLKQGQKLDSNSKQSPSDSKIGHSKVFNSKVTNQKSNRPHRPKSSNLKINTPKIPNPKIFNPKSIVFNSSSKNVQGTGRRKKSTAAIALTSGKGKGTIFINKKPAIFYMQKKAFLLEKIQAPLIFLELQEKVNISIRVKGGGLMGQADAIKLGISRALCQYNADYRHPLKLKGYLTQDARVKERKKYGLKKARKAPQFSKR